MTITVENHSVQAVTGEDWGFHNRTNFESLARGFHVCRASEIDKDALQRLIKKDIVERQRYAVLEQTNYEFKNQKGRKDSVGNLMDWKHVLRSLETWECFLSEHQNYIGSMRDIHDIITNMYPILYPAEFAENGYVNDYLYNLDSLFFESLTEFRRNYLFPQISKSNKMKRVQFLIRTTAEVGHDFRTESRLRQLAISPSKTKIKWGEEMPIVSYDPEMVKEKLFKFEHDQFIYNFWMDVFKETKNPFYSRMAKHSLPEERLSLRVLTGTVKDIETVIQKRRKTPKDKPDMHAFLDVFEKALEDWKNKEER